MQQEAGEPMGGALYVFMWKHDPEKVLGYMNK